MSMKPGQTTSPSASTTSRAPSAGSRPGGVTSRIRPPARVVAPLHRSTTYFDKNASIFAT